MYGEIASGGMATVRYGRLLGPVGFSRTVAIKRLHPHFARDPEFVAMFLDEARLAARIRHPNVVQTLDVVAREGELFLVLDYVQGESLARLVGAARAQERPIPIGVVSAIACGALHGLHAAHEATNERGEPLGIVHRDVSPQNILVGADGVPRVLDFGIAKAAGRINTTREGQLKGKLAYMAPEQLHGTAVDRRTDVYAVGVLLWEALTLRRLFAGESEAAVVTKALNRVVEPPSSIVSGLPEGVDEVVMRALQRDEAKRFASAQEMAIALESCVAPASAMRVGVWIQALAGDVLAMRATSVAEIESDSGTVTLLPSERPQPEAPAPARPPSEPTKVGPSALHSQVSSISVSTSTMQAQIVPKWRRSTVVFAALAVGATALVATTLVGMSSSTNRASAERSSPMPLASTAALSNIPPQQPTAGAEVVAEPAPIAQAPAPTAQAQTRSPRPAPVRAVATRSPASSPASPTASAPSPGSTGQAPCRVKAFVDESGIKHYVRECN